MEYSSLRAITIIVATVLVASCAHYETILTDTQGRTVTCEAQGKNGLVTGHMLRSTFNQCVENAKASGYREGGYPISATPTANVIPDLQAKLRELANAYDHGLITREEYEAKRRSLLDQF